MRDFTEEERQLLDIPIYELWVSGELAKSLSLFNQKWHTICLAIRANK
jgi:hypothetical protein